MEELIQQLEQEVREALRHGDLAAATELMAAFQELVGDEEIPEMVRMKLIEIHKMIVAAEASSMQMRIARHQQRRKMLGLDDEEG